MRHPLLVVLGKEMVDGSRDRRAMMSAFLFPVFGPLLVYFMLNAIIDLRSDVEALRLPVQGMGNAPDLVQWLKEQDVILTPFTGDAKQAVQDGEAELVLVIPDDYQARMASLDTIALRIVMDGSRTDTRSSVGRAQRLISRYNGELRTLRLMARGVDPEVARVVIYQEIDVASKQQLTARALNFIPLYIILAAFISGMGIAVDSTAGERERKSLEALLVNPVERYHLAMGKWIAASLVAAVGIAMTMILCILAMLQVPLDQIGMNFHIQGYQIALMLVATTPLAFFATSLQMMIGIFAKSFKDAQSYIGILTVLPTAPLLYLMFNPTPTQDWMFWVPVLGQYLMLVEALSAKAVPLIAYFASGISCGVVGLGLVILTARLLEKESIISG